MAKDKRSKGLKTLAALLEGAQHTLREEERTRAHLLHVPKCEGCGKRKGVVLDTARLITTLTYKDGKSEKAYHTECFFRCHTINCPRLGAQWRHNPKQCAICGGCAPERSMVRHADNCPNGQDL